MSAEIKERNLRRAYFMKWYQDITNEDKRKFWEVIAVTIIGTIMILLVPVVFRMIF